MLKLANYESSPGLPVSWLLDSPARGVTTIDVTIGDGVGGAPLHFRVGDWSKPPIDIVLDEDGSIAGVQIVLQDETVPPVVASGVSDIPMAHLVFEVDGWPDNRYKDQRAEVSLGREREGLLVVSIGESEAKSYWQLGNGLTVGCSEQTLCELRVGPLTPTEWATVDRAAAT